ncbi:hypothetical protein [Micrococcus luteus]|uniref:hypothetical protein n=1 Tax=Micrococcus luteus TaxID=1270 RepID=UPI0020CC4386|nr:hypothetical protein [Micrococcus luteus]UTT45768.1 hypothetical protein NMQ02_00520 [Micrococcus luteus]
MPSRPTSPGSKPSPAVYRRRRLVAALLALVLLLLVGWAVVALVRAGIGAFSSEDADPSAAPTPVHSPSPAPATDAESGSASPTVALEDAAECQPSDLRIAASADRSEYQRGEEAELRLGITNLSSTPCRTDVGTARQEFTIRTAEGDDVFSTRICQADPAETQRVLYPHEELTAVYRWSGRASSQDCGRPGALAEPGPHLLTVSLGDVTSRPAALKILEELAPGAQDGGSSATPSSATPSSSGSGSPSGSASDPASAADPASASLSPASASASAAPATTTDPSPSPSR